MELVKRAEVILLLAAVHHTRKFGGSWTLPLLRIFRSAIFIYPSASRVHELARARWEQGILRFTGWRLPKAGPFTIYHALGSGIYILFQ